MNTFSVPADRTDELPACSIVAAQPCETSSPILLPDVGAVRRDRLTRPELHALSDAELDAYIRLCIERQNQAQTRWLSGGSLSDAGERDHWLLAEHEARDHRTVRRELARKGNG